MNLRQTGPTQPARRLTDAISGKVALGIGAGDVLQARLIERSGFDFAWVSSLAVCATIGKTEEAGMGSAAYDMLVEAIISGVRIPAMIDANLSGIGEKSLEAHIEFFASVGAAAISIEDKPRPKTNSLDLRQSQEQLPALDYCKIIASARKVAGDRLVIIARIESLISGAGPDDALCRMRLSEEAGADFLILHSRSSNPRDVLDVVDAWGGSCRIGLIPTTYPSLRVAELDPSKVAFAIFANQLTRASIQLHEEMLGRIKREQGAEGLAPQLASMERLFGYLEE